MHRLTRGLVAGTAALALTTIGAIGTATGAQAHTVGEPGDATMLVHINDSEAGGSYDQTFERVYAGDDRRRNARLHLRPEGGIWRGRGRRQPRPLLRPEPGR